MRRRRRIGQVAVLIVREQTAEGSLALAVAIMNILRKFIVHVFDTARRLGNAWVVVTSGLRSRTIGWRILRFTLPQGT